MFKNKIVHLELASLFYLQANRNRYILYVCKDGWCVSTHYKHATEPHPYDTSGHLWYLPAAGGCPGPGTAGNCRQTSSRHSGGCRKLGHEVQLTDCLLLWTFYSLSLEVKCFHVKDHYTVSGQSHFYPGGRKSSSHQLRFDKILSTVFL